MKTKSRTTQGSDAYTQVNSRYGGYSYPNPTYPAGVRSYTDLSETITYQAGKKSFNYCLHERVKRKLYPYSSLVGICNSQLNWDNGRYATEAYNGTTANGLSTLESHVNAGFPAALDFGNLSAEAVRAMWPEVESVIGESVIGTIYELPKVRTLHQQVITGAVRLGKDAKLAWRFWKSTKHARKATPFTGTALAREFLKSAYARRSLRDVLRQVARANLIYRYGIETLVDDVLAVKRSLVHASLEAKRMLDNADIPHTSHWSKDLTVPGSTISTDALEDTRGILNPRIQFRYTRDDTRARYTATMQYRYSIPQWMRNDAAKLAWLDSLGANFSPKVIWDILPWTFVVDWLFKVGEFLDQAKLRMLEPRVQVEQYGFSLKVNAKGKCYIARPGGVIGQGEYLASSYNKDYYYRSPMVPNAYQALELGTPTKYTAVMATSLLLGRKRMRLLKSD